MLASEGGPCWRCGLVSNQLQWTTCQLSSHQPLKDGEPPAALIAVVLGVMAWTLARNDLREMRTGQVDPAGCEQTEYGLGTGRIGLFLGIFTLLVYAAVATLLVAYDHAP
jgi:hypothetical protein